MLEIGALVDGKYKVLNQIGKGGMSVVYLAMNEKANKQWAIKEVRKDVGKDEDVIQQGLIVEMELLKELRHPYLPAIVDVIETEGTFLIVMDYIEGNPLSEALNEYGAQSQENVIEWAKQLCDVLGYLHSREPAIIYRDMKPANIMLKPDGSITLIDFGTARKYKEHNIADTKCLGTIGYAAPEQFAGENQRQTDERTDIYCLGATLYHLVTGHNPCEPPYELYPIRYWNAGLSEGLEKIIQKCTQKNPDDRYQNCAQLLYDLEHYNEINSRYRRKQWGKLVLTLASAACTALSVGVSVQGHNRMEIRTTQDYEGKINEADNLIFSLNNNGEYNSEISEIYEAAIKIDPYRNKAYIKMLEYYSSLGDDATNKGISRVVGEISVYADKIDGIGEIYMAIGKLYLNGNENDDKFKKNAKNAEQYFEKALEAGEENAEFYQALAAVQMNTMKNEKMYEKIQKFEQNIEDETDYKECIEAYLSLANFYYSNKEATNEKLREVLGEETPLYRAIELYEKAYNMTQRDFLDNEEIDIASRYKPKCLINLGQCYSILGKSYFDSENEDSNQKALESYNQAKLYYYEYINSLDDEQAFVVKISSLSVLEINISKCKADYSEALSYSEKLINESEEKKIDADKKIMALKSYIEICLTALDDEDDDELYEKMSKYTAKYIEIDKEKYDESLVERVRQRLEKTNYQISGGEVPHD